MQLYSTIQPSRKLPVLTCIDLNTRRPIVIVNVLDIKNSTKWCVLVDRWCYLFFEVAIRVVYAPKPPKGLPVCLSKNSKSCLWRRIGVRIMETENEKLVKEDHELTRTVQSLGQFWHDSQLPPSYPWLPHQQAHHRWSCQYAFHALTCPFSILSYRQLSPLSASGTRFLASRLIWWSGSSAGPSVVSRSSSRKKSASGKITTSLRSLLLTQVQQAWRLTRIQL